MSVYLINTDFEEVLAQETISSIHEQLQFLPLLYASSTDTLAVSFLPSSQEIQALAQQPWRKGAPLPKLVLQEETVPFYEKPLVYWGASFPLQQWAKERTMSVRFPDPNSLTKVCSKAYSFRYTTLPEAALLFSPADLLAWNHTLSSSRKKVLKTCFGYSGKGLHLFETLSKHTWNFCEREWAACRPVVAEPWLQKTMDLSSQWTIQETGSRTLHGITFFTTNSKGVYRSSYAMPESYIHQAIRPFVEEHLIHCQKVLGDLFAEGYFGPIGCDALLYQDDRNKLSLYPVVEINPRETLSKAILLMQQSFFPNLPLHVFSTSASSVGPTLLPMQSPRHPFPRKWWYSNKVLW